MHARWLELAQCYESQLGNIAGYHDRLAAIRQTHILTHHDARYLEAFYSDRPLDLADLAWLAV
ncbi:hypothetical protein ACFL34_05985 [Candidatus Sumerlaeota bacterium]